MIGSRRNCGVSTIQRGLRTVAHLLYERRMITVYRYDWTTEVEENIQLAELTMQRVAPLVGGYPDYMNGWRLRRFQERLAAGWAGFMAYIGPDPVHLCWVERAREIAEPEMGNLGVPLPRVESLIRDCWTRPEFRRQGIYTAALNHLARSYSSYGAVYVWCHRRNAASARGIERAGFAPVWGMTRGRWFGGLVDRAWSEQLDAAPRKNCAPASP